MTHQELVQAEFKAKAGVLEAQKSYIRSQISLLEAQLKENEVRLQELQFQWDTYLAGLRQQQEDPAPVAAGEEEAAPKSLKKK